MDELEGFEGNCFWGHKWSKWKQGTRKMIYLKSGKEGIEEIQRRTCLRCDKVEDKII